MSFYIASLVLMLLLLQTQLVAANDDAVQLRLGGSIYGTAGRNVDVSLGQNIALGCQVLTDVNETAISTLSLLYCNQWDEPNVCRMEKLAKPSVLSLMVNWKVLKGDGGNYWCECHLSNGTTWQSRRSQVLLHFENLLNVTVSSGIENVDQFYLEFKGVKQSTPRSFVVSIQEKITKNYTCVWAADKVKCFLFRFNQNDKQLTKYYNVTLWSRSHFNRESNYHIGSMMPLLEVARYTKALTITDEFTDDWMAVKYSVRFPFSLIFWNITTTCTVDGKPPFHEKKIESGTDSCRRNQKCNFPLTLIPCGSYNCTFLSEHQLNENHTARLRSRWSTNRVNVPENPIDVTLTMTESKTQLRWSIPDDSIMEDDNATYYNVTIATGDQLLQQIIPGNVRNVTVSASPNDKCQITLQHCNACGCSGGITKRCCDAANACKIGDSQPQGGNTTLIICIVIVAAVLVVGAVIIIVLLVRKRRAQASGGNPSIPSLPLIPSSPYDEIVSDNGQNPYSGPPVPIPDDVKPVFKD